VTTNVDMAWEKIRSGETHPRTHTAHTYALEYILDKCNNTEDDYT